MFNMSMANFHLFDISIYQLNIFSFMLGVTWAFFHQSFFGKSIGKVVFIYFAGLAAWYGSLYFIEKTKTENQQTQTNTEIIKNAQQQVKDEKVKNSALEQKIKTLESKKKIEESPHDKNSEPEPSEKSE